MFVQSRQLISAALVVLEAKAAPQQRAVNIERPLFHTLNIS